MIKSGRSTSRIGYAARLKPTPTRLRIFKAARLSLHYWPAGIRPRIQRRVGCLISVDATTMRIVSYRMLYMAAFWTSSDVSWPVMNEKWDTQLIDPGCAWRMSLRGTAPARTAPRLSALAVCRVSLQMGSGGKQAEYQFGRRGSECGIVFYCDLDSGVESVWVLGSLTLSVLKKCS